MSTIGLIDFKDVEKYVMLFISRNSGKLCSIQDIFNDIVEDQQINNPDIRKDLKIKLNIVMSQLDSNQKNVTVIKKGQTYSVGYNIKTVDNIQEIPEIVVDRLSEYIVNTEQIAKEMFEYIVDNDINYTIKSDCNGENLLFIGITLGDNARVDKLVNKYSMSFFDKNKVGRSVLDLIPDSPMLKYCINENNKEIKNLKDKNTDLCNNIMGINAELLLMKKEILDLKRVNNNRNLFDTTFVVLLFLSFFFKLYM
jgi:hypothetical protein